MGKGKLWTWRRRDYNNRTYKLLTDGVSRGNTKKGKADRFAGGNTSPQRLQSSSSSTDIFVPVVVLLAILVTLLIGLALYFKRRSPEKSEDNEYHTLGMREIAAQGEQTNQETQRPTQSNQIVQQPNRSNQLVQQPSRSNQFVQQPSRSNQFVQQPSRSNQFDQQAGPSDEEEQLVT